MTEKIYRNILMFGMAVIIVFSPIGKGAARIWSITPILLVSYTLIFIWLWRTNNNRQYEFKRTRIDAPIFLFAALAIISSVFSIYKYDSFCELTKLFCYIGLYYLVVNEFDRTMVKRMLYFVVATGTALSIYGILQYLNILGHSWWDPEGFMAATFVNHNHFSGYLELAIPVAVSFILGKSLKRRLLMVLSLVVMMTAFILAQSRGAWISLSVSFLAITYFIARRRDGGTKRAITLALIIVAFISLAYFGRDVISERISGSISAGPVGDSFATRLKIWQGAIDMIKHNPLIGTGIGTFVWGFSKYRPEGLNVMANFAHNDYLQIACEMGIPALLTVLWLLAVVIKKGFSVNNSYFYRIGCVAGILSLSLHALSDFNFHIPANMLLFTVYLAVIMKERE